MSETVFDSLLDVPLDFQDPEADGDDRNVPGQIGTPHAAMIVRPPLEAGVPKSLAVPFLASKRGVRGSRVRALNRALSRAGFRKWQVFSFLFTIWVERALKRFQKSHGLPQTGVYDRATHEKLARFYDAYSIRYLLIAPIPVPTKDEKERAAFLAELMYLYNIRGAIGYTQARAYDRRKPPRGLDCSASGEWAGEQSGIGSLSGYPSGGYGNTDTQYARFRSRGWRREGIADAKLGDPKYYGSGQDPSHVAFFIGKKDGVSRVWSFGSYPIKILDHAYRHDGIVGGVCNLTGR